MRPRHVLHFIQFLFPAIAFCVSEELVVLMTPRPLFAFNHKYAGSVKTWEMFKMFVFQRHILSICSCTILS